MFYFCIPYLNILVRNMNERQHMLLLCLVFFTYVLMGTLPKITVAMNYVSWFICLYFIASYVRMYPKDVFEKTKFCGMCTAVFATICISSVLCCLWLGTKMEKQFAYSFVQDSNTFLPVCMGVSSFLCFKNMKLKQSKVINTIASSTFGVLLIHTNSDTTRKWLWQTVLNVKETFYEPTGMVVLHAVLSVAAIFAICVIIDQIRIKTIERIVLDKVDRGVKRLLHSLEENV